MDTNSFKEASIVEKQGELAAASSRVVDELLSSIETARLNLMAAKEKEDLVAVVNYLGGVKSSLQQRAEIPSLQKDFASLMSKASKTIDKELFPDISGATWNVDFKNELVNEILLSHFFHEGEFALGDLFAEECGMLLVELIKAPYLVMHPMIVEIRQKNLVPVIQWTKARANLNKSFLFTLHQLQFLCCLQTQSKFEALSYARENLEPFLASHLAEIKQTMLCLLWKNQAEKFPYQEIGSEAHWAQLEWGFVKEFCRSICLPSMSPLHVAVEAGSLALPVLLKMASVLAKRPEDWKYMKQLPMEIELGKKFQFHSIFACPVSKEESTAGNPPMLMRCGHVLCKQSMLKLVRGISRTIKCPYCPMETIQADCMPIHF